MFHVRILYVLSLLIAFVCYSCNIAANRLTYLYGKKLSTPQGHLFSGSQLYIYSDSTFEYIEGAAVLKYTKGNWTLNPDQSSITLNSLNESNLIKKQVIDTFYLNFVSVRVELKSRTKIEMNNQIFRVSKR